MTLGHYFEFVWVLALRVRTIDLFGSIIMFLISSWLRSFMTEYHIYIYSSESVTCNFEIEIISGEYVNFYVHACKKEEYN